MMTNFQHPQRKKILIVGQGIAGTVLAHTLSNYNAEITIIDNGHITASSKAASGTYNPLVLKRLVKSWMIDELLPFAYTFYREVSRKLNIELLENQRHYRKIAQESELLDWRKKKDLEEYSPYISEITNKENVHSDIDAPWGYGVVKNVGRIDVLALLQKSKKYFEKLMVHEQFEHANLMLVDTGVLYNNVQYDDVIFCEGYKVSENPFFPEIQMKPVKGEVLVLRIPGLNLKHVIKSSVYVLPVGNDIYHVGSTYQWDVLDETASIEGRELLLKKLQTITTLPVEVLDQLAGVRPASKDRRPILGQSHNHENLHILNGLGAKGLMLSPYFAHQLCENIFNKKSIDPAANLTRFRTNKD